MIGKVSSGNLSRKKNEQKSFLDGYFYSCGAGICVVYLYLAPRGLDNRIVYCIGDIAFRITGLGNTSEKRNIKMGANINLVLPHAACVADVAKIMGKLAGVDTRVRIEPCTDLPSLVTIQLDAPGGKTFVDGEKEHYCYYHFEGIEGRTLTPKDFGWWVAMSKGLIDFYGGKATHDINNEVIYAKPKRPVKYINGDSLDGEDWRRFKARIENVKPFSEDEWKACVPESAYNC